MRMPGLLESKDGARRRRPRRSKVARVAVVCVDHLVTCPSCGNPMQLSKFRTFKCERCLKELTAEEALAALESPEA
jgi:tRNA(Ile2) C34 agmatinyltransferase TiaS